MIGPYGVFCAFLLGANVGSFLNVVAHRLPLRLSVVRPRSRCPACRTPIRAVDNIPVISWVLLGGRCRGCKGAISVRYPVVELLTAALAAHVAHSVAVAPGLALEPRAWAAAAATFLVVAALLAASLIDADHRILPDEITKSGMWAAPAVTAFFPEILERAGGELPAWAPESLPTPVRAALVSVAGIVAGAGVIWAVGFLGTKVFRKQAMGFGDVKFLGMIGGFTGPVGALLVLVAAAFAGSVGGLVRVLVTRDRYIPFGPFLALGAVVVLLHGASLLAWYTQRLTLGF